jgi:hypothetical protein
VHSYVAYGLRVRSALVLPELVSEESAAPDVVLRFGKIDRVPRERDAEGNGFWATADEACRYLADVGTTLVRGGREIVVHPVAGADERMLRLSILGPAFALLLHQRGRLVLHASAIERAGDAVAFGGGSGWGKSTLAAALHARGCALVADDLTAIGIDQAPVTVSPAFPQIKLWPEAVAALGESPETMLQVHPRFDKRARRAARGFSSRRLPLRRIYLLAEGPGPTIEPLRPQEALLGLLANWYGLRFGNGLLEVEGAAAANFRQCASLVKRVSVRRLIRPRELSALRDLARLVEDDLDCGVERDLNDVPISSTSDLAPALERR